MSHVRVVIAVLAVIMFAQVASAITMEQTVTPESLKQSPGQFTITAEKRPDGLIHFTITRQLAKPAYLVAHSTIRDGKKILLDTTATAYAREFSAVYYFAVASDRIADASFDLYVGTFEESGGQPTPTVGGATDFHIQLADFAKAATDAKTEAK